MVLHEDLVTHLRELVYPNRRLGRPSTIMQMPVCALLRRKRRVKSQIDREGDKRGREREMFVCTYNMYLCSGRLRETETERKRERERDGEREDCEWKTELYGHVDRERERGRGREKYGVQSISRCWWAGAFMPFSGNCLEVLVKFLQNRRRA